MHSITFCLYAAAFVLTLGSAAGKCPAWVPVLLVCIAELLAFLPL